MKPIFPHLDPHHLPTEQGLTEWMRALVDSIPAEPAKAKASKVVAKRPAKNSPPKRIKLQKAV